MGAVQNILFSLLALAIAFGFQTYRDLTKPYPKPELDLKEYWGRGDGKNYKEDQTLRPFKISYSDEVIKRLTDKLSDGLTQPFTEPLEDTAFEYGFNSKRLKEVLKYWRDQYLPKWSEREQFLNQYEHFTTQIQGLKIHFLRAKPKANASTKVYPMILLHGWPGSIREFYEIFPLLTTPSKDNIAFEVIAPSLPGYGFSEAASKQGMNTVKMAVIMKNLMQRLGYDKYYVQGGDWGSLIGSHIATLFPENVLGYHSNMCSLMTPLATFKMFIASFYPSYFIEKKYVSWYFPFGPKFSDLLQETGYLHLQATKPDTIGAALSGNPVGLAAYILEKFSTWTNPNFRNIPDGGFLEYFSFDALLDNVMIYYLTNSITTSQRLYKEDFSGAIFEMKMDRVPTEVPVGCARFKYELAHMYDGVLKEKFPKLIHSTHHEDGGHFTAMQLPNVLYNDFLDFVRKNID